MFLKILVGLVTITGAITPNLVQAQVIIQSGSSSATAEGKNNWAVGKVRQSARQRNLDRIQIIKQHGTVDSSARGQNNTVVGNINQSAHQQLHRNQSITQNASGTYRGVGTDNIVDGNIDQRSINY